MQMVYNAIVIGGGPGGYVCAIRCAQLGLSTALVEERTLGGVCLNWGCIPTKALYAATKLVHEASTAEEMGIRFGAPDVDLGALAAWKEQTVGTLTGGVATLLDKNGVDVFHARGQLDGPGRVVLSTGETLEGETIILATGSSPIEIPPFPFANEVIWTSDDALALREIPEHLAVIGGGVVGLELATIYRRLGSEITILELLPEILATLDLDRRTVATLKRSLKAQGMEILTGTRADGFSSGDGRAQLHLSDRDPLMCDRILVAIGRHPNSGELGLETVGVELDERGYIQVNDRLETTADGVYAIGDVVPGPMLAHKASAEGVALAESLAGEREGALVHEAGMIPQAIFTDPEIASIGLSEAAAKAAGQPILVGRFPFAALGKALGQRAPEGLFQIVADANDHRILGAQIIGAEASDLIAEAAMAVQQGLSLEAIADGVHAHPTLPEGLKEAAENALGRAIHAINR